MRSGKVELKRIDDKTSRQVSFSKRRNGLFKKAEELSVLCDVDVALFVVSASGKLYEFPSGDILSKILERYSSLVDVEKTCTRTIRNEDCAESATLWKCKNTLQAAQSYLEGRNVNQMNITDIVQLELLLDSTLVQTRKRKAKGECDALLSKYMQTHLTTDTLSTLQTAEKKQREEEMMKPNETGAIKMDEEEEADDKNKLKKKEQQIKSSTNSEAYCSLQEAMLSLA